MGRGGDADTNISVEPKIAAQRAEMQAEIRSQLDRIGCLEVRFAERSSRYTRNVRFEEGEILYPHATEASPAWYWPGEWLASPFDNEGEAQLLEVLSFVGDDTGLSALKSACNIYSAGERFGYDRGQEVERQASFDREYS